MPTFAEEQQNTEEALLAHAVKRMLEYANTSYCVGTVDMELLKTAARNSSFLAEKVVTSSSVSESRTTLRAYARTQALLRACQMQAQTREDYWMGALDAAKKDETFYKVRTHTDLSLHQEYTTTKVSPSFVPTVVIDTETGSAKESVVSLEVPNLA